MIKRVLIVGFGSMGQRHFLLARRFLPNSEIKILSHNKNNNNNLVKEANGKFTSLEEALKFSPQLAVIASPATVHMESAIPLAKLGAHLFIEKPIATQLDHVEELLSIVNKNTNKILVGYNLKFLPSLNEFRKLIHSGLIGKIYSVRAEVGQFLPSWRPNIDYRDSVSAQKKLGGGVLLELSHELDYLRWIFGDVTSVYASLSSQSDLKIDVEDTAEIILNFSSQNINSSVICSLHLDFVRHDSTRICTVIGKNGTLKWDALAGEIIHFSCETKEWNTIYQYNPESEYSYVSQWQHLMECIEKGQSPLTSGEDALKTLKIIEMARQSAEKGLRVIQ